MTTADKQNPTQSPAPMRASISAKQQQFLHQAVQDFLEQQVISETQAQQMRDFYSVRERKLERIFAMMMGALLLLLGLGQLIAHHWDETAPALRLLLALLLFVAGGSALWRLSERWFGLAILIHSATLGLALVIVAQIFQLQGSLSAFLQQWTWLLIPTWLWSRHHHAGLAVQLLCLASLLALDSEYHSSFTGMAQGLTIIVVALALYYRHWRVALIPVLWWSAKLWLSEQYLNNEELLWLLLQLLACVYPLAKRFAWGRWEEVYGVLAVVILLFWQMVEGSVVTHTFWFYEGLLAGLMLWLGLPMWRTDRLAFALCTTPLLLYGLTWGLENKDWTTLLSTAWLLFLQLSFASRLGAQKRFSLMSVCVLGMLLVLAYRLFTEDLLANALMFALAGAGVMWWKASVNKANAEA